jgi:hypothetical protein
MHARALIATLLLGASPLIAGAQTASAPGSAGARGWFLGIGLHFSGINADDLSEDTEVGTGAFLQAGFGFTPRLALFLEGSGAQMDSEDSDETWMLSHGDLGLRYHFWAPGRRFVPFVEGAVSGWAGTDDDAEFGTQRGELEITGAGLTFGGGFLYYFTNRLALAGHLKFTRGEFNSVRFENVTVDGFDIDATSTRVNLGVSWFLGGGR